LGQALQKNPACAEKNPRPDAIHRIGNPSPQKLRADPKPAQPKKSKNDQTRHTQLTNGYYSKVMGWRRVFRRPIIDFRAVEHRGRDIVVIFVRRADSLAVGFAYVIRPVVQADPEEMVLQNDFRQPEILPAILEFAFIVLVLERSICEPLDEILSGHSEQYPD